MDTICLLDAWRRITHRQIQTGIVVAGIFNNRVTEKDVRLWLDQNGFYGRSAQITDLELHAIERPGWRQIFRFTIKAKPKLDHGSLGGLGKQEGEKAIRHGIVLDDQRKRTADQQTQVFIFESIEERNRVLEERSAGMLSCSNGQNADLVVLSIVVVTFIFLSLLLGILIGN